MPSICLALSLLAKSYQRRVLIMDSYILHKQRNYIISRYLTRFLVQLVKREVCWHNTGRLLYFILIVLLFDPNITKTSILCKSIQINPIPDSWNPAMFAELPDVIVRFTWQYRFMIITGNPKIVVIKIPDSGNP